MSLPHKDRALRVRVVLYGVLRTAANTGRLELEVDAGTSVRQLVTRVVHTIARTEFEKSLIDAESQDPRPNALIIVSGTEIGALNGLDTALKEGDEILFLPVVHGGAERMKR